MTPADLATTIEQALLTVLDVEDFESTPGFERVGVDVSGDDWTWHIEDDGAWLAIDDEPDDPAAYATAIEKNLTEPVLAALRDIDPAILVVLSELLAASGDPISLAFVDLLRRNRSQEEPIHDSRLARQKSEQSGTIPLHDDHTTNSQ